MEQKTLLIVGSEGRMGRQIALEAGKQGYSLLGVDRVPGGGAFPVYDSLDKAPAADVLVDFSSPACLDGILAYARRHRVPCVLATTGYTDAQRADVEALAKDVPVFRSANMSVGIAVTRYLARKARQMLGEAFDVEIIETHHRQKVDAPSGTAMMLYEAVRDACPGVEPLEAVYGRQGNARREVQEIGIHAVRGGTVAGEHEVRFFGNMERVTIHHSAEDRAVFAVGAVRAATFLLAQSAGMYDMDDMLGIRTAE